MKMTETDRKGLQIGKEEVKLVYFSNDKTDYVESSKDATRKILELISKFGMFAIYKSIYKSQLASYMPAIKNGIKMFNAICTIPKMKELGINLTKYVRTCVQKTTKYY